MAFSKRLSSTFCSCELALTLTARLAFRLRKGMLHVKHAVRGKSCTVCGSSEEYPGSLKAMALCDSVARNYYAEAQPRRTSRLILPPQERQRLKHSEGPGELSSISFGFDTSFPQQLLRMICQQHAFSSLGPLRKITDITSVAQKHKLQVLQGLQLLHHSSTSCFQKTFKIKIITRIKHGIVTEKHANFLC